MVDTVTIRFDKWLPSSYITDVYAPGSNSSTYYYIITNIVRGQTVYDGCLDVSKLYGRPKYISITEGEYQLYVYIWDIQGNGDYEQMWIRATPENQPYPIATSVEEMEEQVYYYTRSYTTEFIMDALPWDTFYVKYTYDFGVNEYSLQYDSVKIESLSNDRKKYIIYWTMPKTIPETDSFQIVIYTEGLDEYGNTVYGRDYTYFMQVRKDAPPEPVRNLTSQPANDKVILSWQNPPDKDLAGVCLIWYTDTLNMTDTINFGVCTTYTHVTRRSYIRYHYEVSVYDSAGKFSPICTVSCVPFDTIPPNNISQLKLVDITNSSITIKWQNPQDTPEKDYWGTRVVLNPDRIPIDHNDGTIVLHGLYDSCEVTGLDLNKYNFVKIFTYDEVNYSSGVEVRHSGLTFSILDYFNNDEPFNKEVT